MRSGAFRFRYLGEMPRIGGFGSADDDHGIDFARQLARGLLAALCIRTNGVVHAHFVVHGSDLTDELAELIAVERALRNDSDAAGATDLGLVGRPFVHHNRSRRMAGDAFYFRVGWVAQNYNH